MAQAGQPVFGKSGFRNNGLFQFQRAREGVNQFVGSVAEGEATGRQPVMNRCQFPQLRHVRGGVGNGCIHGLPQRGGNELRHSLRPQVDAEIQNLPFGPSGICRQGF